MRQMNKKRKTEALKPRVSFVLISEKLLLIK